MSQNRNNERNTRQRDAIMRVVKRQTREFLVKDIYAELAQRGEEVGLTTIYRVVDRLVDDGYVKRLVREDGSLAYQYLESCEQTGHCYLKCRVCGTLRHIDCDLVSKLAEHTEREHDFLIDTDSIIIPGVCTACAEEDL